MSRFHALHTKRVLNRSMQRVYGRMIRRPVDNKARVLRMTSCVAMANTLLIDKGLLMGLDGQFGIIGFQTNSRELSA